MKVIKRNGSTQDVDLNKITKRLKDACFQKGYKPLKAVDYDRVAITTIQGLKDGITTEELDILAAETAASMATYHPDYSVLGGRILHSNLTKKVGGTFEDYVEKNDNLRYFDDHEIKVLSEHLKKSQPYDYDFFGFKTLERAYLQRKDGKIIETPMFMLARVALAIEHQPSKAIALFDELNEGKFTFATPTLFNAGTKKQQLSSCFLLSMTEDSIKGIFETLDRTAKISQHAGGIGLSVSNIRAKGSEIKGTGGTSNGLVPMLRVYNNTARYVDQGGGRRKGSFAMYLEPWHADIFDFLELKKNHGKEEHRARDLFYGLWIPDLFMKRVEEDGDWTLFCPNEAPHLYDVHSDEFVILYESYEKQRLGKRTVKARELWNKILESQIETGTPYMLYKDACNAKSNQQNLGTIRSSNLCTEIIEYTNEDEVAVCNLASIALPKFVQDGKFNFRQLMKTAERVTRWLDKIIDINFYPVEEAKNSNEMHRPIGIGVQGLADVFAMLGMDFDSEEAKKLNERIFASMYYAAIIASADLAAKNGIYESFIDSPAEAGLLQFDLWGKEPIDGLDWEYAKEKVAQYGLNNSLLLAPMPTASTSQILGNNECFEPFTSNMYTRRTLSGEYIVINKHLVADLEIIDKWNEQMRQDLMRNNGSVQNLDVPDYIKNRYKTAYEIKQRHIIDMAADRGAYICQSQSMNLFVENPNFAKLTSMHFYAWKKGLKTGMYYLRSKAAVDPIKFTVEQENKACNLDDPDCLSCGA